MNSIKNSFKYFRITRTPLRVVFAYYMHILANRISANRISAYFWKSYVRIHFKDFKKKWLKTNSNGASYFDFNGAKLPDVSGDNNLLVALSWVFQDVFLVPCYYKDNHDKKIVDFLDICTHEGTYGYVDEEFDVTVKKNDVVIDAGAWIGDFCAYASSKGAVTYAFEPVEETFNWLCKTADMNEGIHPVNKGLGSSEKVLNIYKSEEDSGSNSVVFKRDEGTLVEEISITTLDKFVEENELERVDFIKADIEGAERDFLKGAAKTLQKFAPKLAICTYHLPDDPEVLKTIILEANPKYKVIQLRHKLFAAVVERKQ